MSKSIKKNYLYNSAYQILIMLTPLLTAPYISRVLGPEKIGIYAYTYSIAHYFMLFAMIGVNNYGNRSCAIVRDDRKKLSKTFCEIYSCQLILGIVVTVIYIIWAFTRTGSMRVNSLIMIMTVLSAVLDINWFFFGLEEFKLTTIRNFIVKIATVSLIFICVKTEADLWKYTAILSAGFLVSQLAVWPFVHKYIDFVNPKKLSCIQHIKPMLILFIPVIAVSIYKIMDKIMLGSMCNMIQTGYYENTEKLMNIPLGLINSLGVIMLPRMSNLAGKKDNKQANILIDKSITFVGFLSVAMAFGLASVAKEFVPFFFGQEFVTCINLVMCIAPTMIFFSLANVIRTQYLLPNKKDKSYIISVFAGAIVNLTFNALLIPKYAALGAVIGTLLAEATVCIIQMYYVRKVLPVKSYCVKTIPFILFGIIMFVFVRMASGIFNNIVICIVFEVFVGAVIYCTLSCIYMYFFNKEVFQSVLKIFVK